MMRTMMVVTLMAVVGMACAMGPEQERGPGFGVRTQALDGGCGCVDMPAMPTIGTRLNFDRYTWSNPLYPVGTVQSAYTIVMPHPAGTGRYLAYGWDVKGNRSVFAGEGTTSLSFANLRQRISNDETTTVAAGLITVGFGGSGEIGPGPTGPGPGGPVTDQAAYLAAYKHYLAHQELMDWSTP